MKFKLRFWRKSKPKPPVGVSGKPVSEPEITLTLTPRLLNHFCDAHHQAAYNNWLSELGKVAKTQADVNLANATIQVWELARKNSKLCYYCSRKLLAARRSTI